ncbi:hypothetical protein [Winogradskyella sp.]|uniref:hypothetical protein n=1 Tax=Winogradskyella sp. TaxID=1883156 RepID=UPI002612A6C1|nr:hypothetical protein [Winogradskyella sp.]
MENQITVNAQEERPNYPVRKDWVKRFYQYRSQNDFVTSAQMIWTDWTAGDNPFFELLPNVDALIFSLATYVPDRNLNFPNLGNTNYSQNMRWNSTPVYDTTYNWWNSIPPWTCADWKEWHRQLEMHFEDTYKANAIWEAAYESDDNKCLTIWLVSSCPSGLHCRSDCDFVEYFASKDIQIGNFFTNTTCDITNIATNIVETVEQTSENAKSIVPLTATVLLVAGSYRLVNQLIKQE